MNTSNEQLQWSPDLWVLLWSKSQCALHVEPFADMLQANMEALAGNLEQDYLPLFAGTQSQVDEVAKHIRPLMVERSSARVPQ